MTAGGRAPVAFSSGRAAAGTLSSHPCSDRLLRGPLGRVEICLHLQRQRPEERAALWGLGAGEAH